jgi:pSer/pThr/pTyr-binding forkhead associated (FHA) protein
MALTIVVRSGDAASPPRITFDAPRIVIGRGEGCDVRLPDPTVSHRHASLRQRGSDYIIVDEDSTNGTFVGPVRLPPQTPRGIRSGDLVRVGRVWLELFCEQALATEQAHLATQKIALALVADALNAEGQVSGLEVRVTEGTDAGAEAVMPEGLSLVVGRAPGCGLVLSDADASRRHCEVMRRGTQVLVRDLGSKNGTRLGGELIPPGKDVSWRLGTPLAIGGDRIQYHDAVAEALAELERAADERMSADEPVDPPAGLDAPAIPRLPEGLGLTPHPGDRQAPIAAIPKGVRRKPAPSRGWTGTDWLVALFALLVLAVSVVGLYWLFRSD